MITSCYTITKFTWSFLDAHPPDHSSVWRLSLFCSKVLLCLGEMQKAEELLLKADQIFQKVKIIQDTVCYMISYNHHQKLCAFKKKTDYTLCKVSFCFHGFLHREWSGIVTVWGYWSKCNICWQSFTSKCICRKTQRCIATRDLRLPGLLTAQRSNW